MGRRRIAGLGIVLLLVVGCSGDDDDAAATSPTTSSGSEPDSAGATNTDDENSDPAIAEGGDWRIAVRSPTAGLAIESRMNLCVEISAPTEAVNLEVRLRPGGSFEDSAATTVAATAGDNALPMDLPEPEGGFEQFLKYDLDVQVLADGAPDLVATVLGIQITGDTFDEVTCD